MFFYYQLSPLGKWCPCTSPDRPNAKSADSGTRQIKQVLELKPEAQNLSLDMLSTLYPLVS